MTELVWEGKYDAQGKKQGPVRIALPFQTIETVNESAQERQRTLELFSAGREPQWRNRLIWGDKKYVLPSLLPEFQGKVNLIYIDPPFDTGANFSFTASIPHKGGDSLDEPTEFVKEPSILEQKAYRDTWGRGLDSYLDWFYEAAVVLRDLLTEDGSIYVHLDWRLVHYARVALDEVFGFENFRNQLIWKRQPPRGARAVSSQFARSSDSILFYSKGEKWVWNPQYKEYDEKYVGDKFKPDKDGRLFRIDTIGTYSEASIADFRRQNKIYDYPSGKLGLIRYLDEAKGEPVGDIWMDIAAVNSQAIERVDYPTQKPEALLERMIKGSSNEGDLLLDCFAGSGTTSVVAEKSKRRWITCDLGRFAIHTTRKRLLGIPNVRPFVMQNLGKYERQVWQAAEFPANGTDRLEEQREREAAYRQFILELYHATPLTGHGWLHGVKGGRMVHVGAVDAPVTLADVKAIAAEAWKAEGKERQAAGGGEESQRQPSEGGEKSQKLPPEIPRFARDDSGRKAAVDILGWEFAFEVNELAKTAAAESRVEVAFKKIPREVLEKKAVEQGDVHFFELGALDVEVKKGAGLKAGATSAAKGREVQLKLKDFVIPMEDIPEEARRAIKHWSQLIDYWAVDWDYKKDTFHNQWQSYRTRKNPKIELDTKYGYKDAGEYQIVVKVIDILGNDTSKTLEVTIR